MLNPAYDSGLKLFWTPGYRANLFQYRANYYLRLDEDDTGTPASQVSVGQAHSSPTVIEVGRLFADTGQRIETVSAVGLVIRVRFHEPPDGCYVPLAHARLAPASGLDEARGLPPLRCLRVVPCFRLCR